MRLHTIVQVATIAALLVTALEFWEDAAGMAAFVWQGISVLMIGLLIVSMLRERGKVGSNKPTNKEEG